jgi:hypothetical protein
MAYYSVQEALDAFLENYPDLTTAILKAQVRKNTAKSKTKYEFWLEVENKLKEMKVKKKSKWED